jgi:hypothetical protein
MIQFPEMNRKILRVVSSPATPAEAKKQTEFAFRPQHTPLTPTLQIPALYYYYLPPDLSSTVSSISTPEGEARGAKTLARRSQSASAKDANFQYV